MFSAYLPTYSELTTAQLKAARDNLVTWLATAWPDLDTRPNSVFDGLMLQPVAGLTAAVALAVERWQADLDVAGVANGTVFDCVFVEKYLAGLGVRREESIPTVGYVLLTFNVNADVNIAGGMRVTFNGSDDFIPVSFPDSELFIRAEGTVRTDPQVYPLVALSSNSWGVVLPVTGYATDVAAGADATWTVDVPGLVAVTALQDFQVGRVNNSVPAMARRTQEVIHASGFCSRKSTRRMLMQVFPDLQGCVVTTPGDAVLLRSALTPLGLASAGVMDVHVSGRSKTVLTQYVQLTWDISSDCFVGVWTPAEQPLLVRSVKYVGNTDLVLLPELFSFSLQPGKPLLTCAYSSNERLEWKIPMPRNTNGGVLVETTLTGSEYKAWFAVQYVADPAVHAIERFVVDESPAGVDVQTRAPIPVEVSQLRFEYRIAPGVLFNQEQAREDITTWFDTCFGNRAFSAEDLADYVYAAGADSITRIVFRAVVHTGVSKWVVEDPDLSLVSDIDAVVAAALPVPKPQVTDIRAAGTFSYLDPNVGEASETLASAGANMIFILNDTALEFARNEV